MIASTSEIRAHCPECNRLQRCFVRASHTQRSNFGSEKLIIDDEYHIGECGGCKAIIFYHATKWSGDWNTLIAVDKDAKTFDIPTAIQVWPKPNLSIFPIWLAAVEAIDIKLFELMRDARKAQEFDLKILAAIGLRTAFDRATELCDVDPADSFAEKLSQLQRNGEIGESEKELLTILVDAGSAAAHRGWEPKNAELGALFDVIEGFVRRRFLLNAEVKEFQNNIPKRSEKKK